MTKVFKAQNNFFSRFTSAAKTLKMDLKIKIPQRSYFKTKKVGSFKCSTNKNYILLNFKQLEI